MKKFAHILIVLLSIYLSYIFTNIAVPRVQFFMDLANYKNTGTVEVFKYDTEYRSLTADVNGVYSTEYTVYDEPISISFSVVDDAPINVKINEKDFFNIGKIVHSGTGIFAYICIKNKLFRFCLFSGIILICGDIFGFI